MIVVDTNVLVHAVLPGERTADVVALARRDSGWAAPPLWRSEFRNVLATLLRAQRLDIARGVEAFEAAEGLVVDADLGDATADVLALCARHEISTYDAEFVLTASRLGTQLVTCDRRLADALPDRVMPLEGAGSA